MHPGRTLAFCVAFAVVAAGCLGGTPVGDDAGIATPAEELLEPRAVAQYLHNLSSPIPGVNVHTAILEQIRIPAADGILLDTWIVRPDVEGPVPVVLEVTPYYGGGPPVGDAWNFLGAVADTLVPRGYAFGISSVRGTGNSEGCFTIGGPTESKDTAAVIEHVASQDWSNGNVGLIGVSYPGTTPQDVWVEAPPGLRTVVPISGISDLYKYNFVNGAPIWIQGYGFNTYYWAMVGLSPVGLTGGAQALDPLAVPGTVIGEACPEQLDVQTAGVQGTLDGNKGPYWQERDFVAKLAAGPDKERASFFYIHGLQDWNVKPHHMEDWVDAVQATGVPFKAWLGQWGHSWPSGLSGCPEERACRGDWWEEVLVAWFDQFLKETDTGILDAPPVQVQDTSMRWRHEAQWPPADLDWRSMHPTGDGALGQTPGNGTASYFDHRGGLPTGALLDEGPDRLEFTSAPLDADAVLSGQAVFAADVTASGSRATLILSLLEERSGGERRAIAWAVQSLNHAEDLEEGDPDIAGKTVPVEVRFFPHDVHLQEGSRLVLVASGEAVQTGGNGPSIRPVADGSTITLHLDTAELRLPFLGAQPVLEAPQPWTT